MAGVSQNSGQDLKQSRPCSASSRPAVAAPPLSRTKSDQLGLTVVRCVEPRTGWRTLHCPVSPWSTYDVTELVCCSCLSDNPSNPRTCRQPSLPPDHQPHSHSSSQPAAQQLARLFLAQLGWSAGRLDKMAADRARTGRPAANSSVGSTLGTAALTRPHRILFTTLTDTYKIILIIY